MLKVELGVRLITYLMLPWRCHQNLYVLNSELIPNRNNVQMNILVSLHPFHDENEKKTELLRNPSRPDRSSQVFGVHGTEFVFENSPDPVPIPIVTMISCTIYENVSCGGPVRMLRFTTPGLGSRVHFAQTVSVCKKTVIK